MAKKVTKLAAGPTAPLPAAPGAPEGGKPPPWWPEWMPWIDLDAWRQIFKNYGEFVNPPGGKPPPTGGEAIQNVRDYLEDWYKKGVAAIESQRRK